MKSLKNVDWQALSADAAIAFAIVQSLSRPANLKRFIAEARAGGASVKALAHIGETADTFREIAAALERSERRLLDAVGAEACA